MIPPNSSGIRIATPDDQEKIEYLCSLFFSESPYSKLSYSIDETKELVKAVLQIPYQDAVVLLSDHGILAARRVKFPFSTDYVTIELVWYIEPTYRGSREGLDLFEAYQFWSKNIARAKACQMVCLPDFSLGTIYERKGFVETERTYMKVFE